MKKVLITGSSGLIGSQAVRLFHGANFFVLGIDDGSRSSFFGSQAKTKTERLLSGYKNYRHLPISILDTSSLETTFSEMKPDLIIHAAGQPSHDWAAEHPVEDFEANARGTLNMLHLAKKHSPECVFIFTSTNKVYGDRPNTITEYQEKETRWEPFDKSCVRHGFDENLSVDQCKHSLFGVSKLYADMIVQEYGRYFGMKTGVFRLGCVTGPDHAGVEQHGFLSYLFKCFREKKKYVIHGYKGKQVRDNIHSFDVAMAFKEFYNNPRPGEVYNMGGGEVNCSILEVIGLLEKISGRKMDIEYSETPRKGDHIWYVSDTRKFKKHYPEWTQAYSLSTIVEEMISRGGI